MYLSLSLRLSLSLSLRSRSKAVAISAACKPATTVSCASILVKSRSLQRITRSSKVDKSEKNEPPFCRQSELKLGTSLLPQVPDRFVDCVHVP